MEWPRRLNIHSRSLVVWALGPSGSTSRRKSCVELKLCVRSPRQRGLIDLAVRTVSTSRTGENVERLIVSKCAISMLGRQRYQPCHPSGAPSPAESLETNDLGSNWCIGTGDDLHAIRGLEDTKSLEADYC